MRTSTIALICVALAALGCGEGPTDVEGVAESLPDIRPYVAGAALESLDERGRFRLARPSVDGPYPLISADQAGEIALGVIRTWYANPNAVTLSGLESLTASVERQHGAPIEWSSVRSGALGPYFAESHLEPLPTTADLPTIRHAGPRFLVPLYVGEEPVVVVSVAGYATNTSVDDDGFIRRTDPSGNEFRVTGIPLELDGVTLPPAPEIAVHFAASLTGAKIVEAPVLGMPGNRVLSTGGSRWRLVLDRELEFERLVDGEIVTTRVVFIKAWPSITDARLGLSTSGAALRLFVAAPDQPETEELGFVEGTVRPGYVVDLNEARVRR